MIDWLVNYLTDHLTLVELICLKNIFLVLNEKVLLFVRFSFGENLFVPCGSCEPYLIVLLVDGRWMEKCDAKKLQKVL